MHWTLATGHLPLACSVIFDVLIRLTCVLLKYYQYRYRNWAHDLVIKAFRFDRVNSPSATWGTNGTVVENVVWRSAAACFKGDHHTIASNTVFDSSDEQITAALFVMMYDPTKPWAIKGENAHTKLQANAADSIFNVSGALPGTHHDNVGDTCVRDMLVRGSPDNGPHYDFRPKDGSAMAKVGAGAFKNSGSPWWVPGPRGGSPATSGSSNVTCVSAETCRAYYAGVRAGIVQEYGGNSSPLGGKHFNVILVVAASVAAVLIVAVSLAWFAKKRRGVIKTTEQNKEHYAPLV